jgi:hypothetical protein
MFVVASKVKAFMKAQEVQVSKEVLEKLSETVEAMLTQAAARAKSRGKTGVKTRVSVNDL